MNLIGKILTVVIFILSIIFMTMVLAVYATHKNWREAVMTPPRSGHRDQTPGLEIRP